MHRCLMPLRELRQAVRSAKRAPRIAASRAARGSSRAKSSTRRSQRRQTLSVQNRSSVKAQCGASIISASKTAVARGLGMARRFFHIAIRISTTEWPNETRAERSPGPGWLYHPPWMMTGPTARAVIMASSKANRIASAELPGQRLASVAESTQRSVPSPK